MSAAQATTERAPAGYAYLTDGMRLFRIVAPFMHERPQSALLEDCFTLETRFYASDELAEMPLRPVRAIEEGR
jgi:hypothetical protein